MSRFQQLNLALRALTELGVVAGFAYWGYSAGNGPTAKIVLAIGAPLLGFGFWGAVDFHQAGRMGEPLRLAQELVISGIAALALIVAGRHMLGWSLAALSVMYHLLVYLSGDRLLKH
jgi:hypothetical protein